jgi:hypothetical protein
VRDGIIRVLARKRGGNVHASRGVSIACEGAGIGEYFVTGVADLDTDAEFNSGSAVGDVRRWAVGTSVIGYCRKLG